MTWRWLNEAVVLAMHDELIAEHGGGADVRDAGLLSSALARPANHRASGVPDVFALAAACAAGIIWEHPFLAGDKRTGFWRLNIFAFL